ncbi:uncharacterized protein LOC110933381 [Helianthus annuus]|uniref:uncharacterized protein LOC110933381 n=1 Tax=Helianthus annuus TaxID=4232 RepID=UPI001652C17D|nr:uncharacterized protein LOC110933381 [Helianthus annuus]
MVEVDDGGREGGGVDGGGREGGGVNRDVGVAEEVEVLAGESGGVGWRRMLGFCDCVIQEVHIMAEEFYNTFYKAFTSESFETSAVTPKTITKPINENIKHDNFYGTHSKPPTLESIEDYTWWKERFINWAKAYAHESWFCLEFGYSRPVNDKGEDLLLKSLSKEDKSEFAAEQRMIALIQSSIRNDMFALLQHDSMKGESVRQMIERFGHLKIELDRFGIVKTREEIIDKIIEALPRADQWQTHELELQKQSKMNGSSHQQNVGLYYKGNIPSVKVGDSPKTTFSGEKIKEPQTSSSSYNPGYHSSFPKANSEESEEVLCNIALNLKNSPAMSINAAKQQMSFLASMLESYEASCIRRAQRYMEITGKQSIGGPSTKLGFDKSKVTCFRCKQKGHFKRECKNSEVDETEKPFNDDYHQKILPEEDRVDNRSTTHGKNISKSKHYAFVAEIKEKTREEILNEKTYRERSIAGNRIDEMQEEYEDAVSYKIWDKKRECYVNRNGEPVVPKKNIIFDDVLLVIPRSVEYYSNVEKDKTYVKRLEKLIRDVMISSLRKRDEERMKKNVESLVDNLKKFAEEVKVEAVKVEKVKEKEEKVVVNEETVKEAILPEEDRVDNRSTTHGKNISKSKHYAFVAEIKEKTREEILNEKTYRERSIAGNRIDEMQEEYEDAVSYKIWDKKRECYVNRNGEPVVPKKNIIFDDVLLVIPRSVEYYSNVEKDKTYVKRLEKLIRDVMISSLRKRDEERMKKNVESLVDNLKKFAEEVKVEAVKVEKVKEKEEKVVVNEETVKEAILPEEDRVDNRSTTHGKNISKSKHYAFVAEIKEKTREEILNEKTYRERSIAGNRIDEMQEEYEDAVSYKIWDKKRECYVNRNGEPVVPKKNIIFDDVLLVIPRSVEYYSNVEKDKTYVKRLEKLIRDVMISSLRKRDEERMKKNVESLVDNLKKFAEEVKVEAVKVEKVKEKEEKVVVNEETVKEAILPEEDRVDNRSTTHGKNISKSKHYAFVAEIKEKTREEILNEKTYRERSIAGNRIDEMQEEYEDAVSYKIWDKKRECYVNRNGEPVVPKKNIIFDDVLLVIPRSVEYYSNVEKDKTYVKRLEKLIRDVMISSLRKRDEERMKKNVESLVDNLKKFAEEVKVEAVKVEKVKEKEEKVVVNEETVKEAVLPKIIECQQEECRSSLAQGGEEAAEPCLKKQEEKQKRRRKKVVIESSEDTDSVSKDENTSRAIVLHTSEQQQVNSDDDFVDPPPRVKQTKYQKKEKAESKPKRSLRKDKTEEQPEQQPCYDYDEKKINIRCAVNNLKDYIENMSKEQKKVVREIGFGTILSLKLHSVPCKFGYWLVKNFDAENDEKNTGDEKIKITAELIQKILYAYKKQGFDDAENTEEFSLDKIDSTTLQEFEVELEIVALNEGREKDEDDAEEQPNININSEEIEDGNTLLKAATDWIEQEDQEDVQNSQLKTNETEKTQTESGGSWGQFFIKPSKGNKDKLWVDSQCRLRNFMPSQIQSEGLSDIHSTKSGDENMKNIEGKKSNEEYVVTALDYHFKGFEEVFESIQSRIDEIIEEYPNSEIVHNKVNEWASLIEKFNDQAKKHKKVSIDSTLIETPSRFLNLSQNEDTENQNISTPLIVKCNDDATKRNEDNTTVVQSSNPEKIIENEPTSSLQTHIENPSLALTSSEKEETEKEEKMIEAFTKNIEKILQGAKLKSIKNFKIILVPILHSEHFFVISFNLEEKQIFIIDNSAKAVTNIEKYGDVPENTVSFPTYAFKTQI